jgi:pteridine reductase
MSDQTNILAKVPLARSGEASDIANTALFLATNAPYISGQIISVDGGRTAGA